MEGTTAKRTGVKRRSCLEKRTLPLVAGEEGGQQSCRAELRAGVSTTGLLGFLPFFLNGGELLYNVGLASALQQRDHTYTCVGPSLEPPPTQPPLSPSRLPAEHRVEPLCCTAASH